MNRRAVVTVNIGEKYNRICKLTHSTIEAYAKRIKAEFIVISQNNGSDSAHWAKFQLLTLLGKYDRIIYVDSDLIIRDDCPDLFNLVPSNKLGIFEEGKFISRSEYINAGMQNYDMYFDWKGQYFNTGVMVLSRQHRYLFREPPTRAKENRSFIFGSMQYTFLGEQTYLNLVMQQEMDIEKDFFCLLYKFNRMSLMDELTGEARHASYIIHYAGCPSQDLMLDLIKKDFNQWKKDKENGYKYKKNIVITASGGLGDQVCGEPIARYIIEKMHPNDKVSITTHWPEIFNHLDVPIFKPDHKFNLSAPHKVYSLYSDEKHPIWKVISNSLINTTDFGSILACRRMIPDSDKHIKLKPNEAAIKEVYQVATNKDIEKMILVHPGRGYDAKTFPIKWWNKIIQELSVKYKIGIIGKHINDKQGTLEINISGNDNVIDFRDTLSLEGLMTIIKLGKILITNDSAPVHIAGAFDNWIVLIPTMKHADHVLPYRGGYKYYKAISVCKKLTVDGLNRKTNEEKQRIDLVEGDINDYLPETEQVINTVVDIYNNKIGEQLCPQR